MRAIPTVGIEQDVKFFKSMIALVVLVDAIVRPCSQVRVLVIFEQSMTVIVCPFAFLARLMLPLLLLVFELLRRIKVKPYQLLSNRWLIIRANPSSFTPKT